MRVIVVSGYARHGKDTTAIILRDYLQARGQRVLITHYADLLKYICKEFLEWDGNKDEKGRCLLQNVGTNIIRRKKPDFWVDFIIDILKFFDYCWDVIIIPDARFPNEINRLRECGFDVTHIRVIRPDFVSALTEEQKAHSSEHALDEIEPDFYVNNNGNLDDLKNEIYKSVTGGLII